MGEYHTIRKARTIKTVCKVGTCTDWRLVTRREAERLAIRDAGNGANFQAALREPSVLFRFPLLDTHAYSGCRCHEAGHEHGTPLHADVCYETTVDAIRARDREATWSFTVPLALARRVVTHEARWFSLAPADGACNVNVSVPCPCREDFSLQSSPIPDRVPVNIVGERYQDGAPVTVFACGWCNARFVADEGECEWLRQECLLWEAAAKLFAPLRSATLAS
ncbi:MAG: hypothetical protein IPH13_20065 [Planctomycetes bacterium]|nr:hypothetical protein [Planctomycetota bacterium]